MWETQVERGAVASFGVLVKGTHGSFRGARGLVAPQAPLTIALGIGQEFALGERKVDNGNSWQTRMGSFRKPGSCAGRRSETQEEVELMNCRRVFLTSVVVAAVSLAAFAQTAPTKPKANVGASDDELVKVTCKQMVWDAGPDAYTVEHFTFNMTKQLLWTDAYGSDAAAPKMPLHIHVSPSQVTWEIDAYTTKDGRHVFETHSFDRAKLVLKFPKGHFTSGYTEQCSIDKPKK